MSEVIRHLDYRLNNIGYSTVLNFLAQHTHAEVNMQDYIELAELEADDMFHRGLQAWLHVEEEDMNPNDDEPASLYLTPNFFDIKV